MTNLRYDWNEIDAWAPLRVMSWRNLDELARAATPVLLTLRQRFSALASTWDDILQDLKGDPCRCDWRRFRPLRLTREEDWSDWLAYLTESSITGFGMRLFRGRGRPNSCEREQWAGNMERRADIVIAWPNNHFSHVEVKVGDQNFSKTFDTAALFNERGGQWDHYILLPEADLEYWQQARLRRLGFDNLTIDAKTWRDVAVALRQTLRAPEDYQWRAFARALCGAIEQHLLGHVSVTAETEERLDISNLPGLRSMIRVMEASLDGR